jgi:hypothetical protein
MSYKTISSLHSILNLNERPGNAFTGENINSSGKGVAYVGPLATLNEGINFSPKTFTNNANCKILINLGSTIFTTSTVYIGLQNVSSGVPNNEWFIKKTIPPNSLINNNNIIDMIGATLENGFEGNINPYQPYALVILMETRVESDNIILPQFANTLKINDYSLVTLQKSFPSKSTTLNNTSWARQGQWDRFPIISLSFEDGDIGFLEGNNIQRLDNVSPPVSLNTSNQEVGIKFKVRKKEKINKIVSNFSNVTPVNLNINLYSNPTSTPTLIYSHTPPFFTSFSGTSNDYTDILSTPIILEPNIEYGLVYKRTNQNISIKTKDIKYLTDNNFPIPTSFLELSYISRTNPNNPFISLPGSDSNGKNIALFTLETDSFFRGESFF